MDEQWWWFPESMRISKNKGCSVIGCFREEGIPALLAQNMDIPNIFQGLDVLLRIKSQNSVESFIYTFAGLVALCGINNKSIGICCNTIIDLNHSTVGYPVAFIVRTVLEHSNMEKAIEFIRGIKHASGQTYTLGNSQEIVSLECSSNKVVQYIPYKGARRVYHTNHPLVNDDVIFPSPREVSISTSHPRLAYLDFRLRDESAKIIPETVKHILSSHAGPICVHSNNQHGYGYTFGSLVYVLSNRPELHLARGPPCINKYELYSFN
jgi:hypothetical protein